MTSLTMKEIITPYGVIFSRNALIVRSHTLQLAPLTLEVRASLSLRGCRPPVADQPEVDVVFTFRNIESLSIYPLDDYPYEHYTASSFDEVEGTYEKGRQRTVLSTYDHVFDVIGTCEMTEG